MNNKGGGGITTACAWVSCVKGSFLVPPLFVVVVSQPLVLPFTPPPKVGDVESVWAPEAGWTPCTGGADVVCGGVNGGMF